MFREKILKCIILTKEQWPEDEQEYLKSQSLMKILDAADSNRKNNGRPWKIREVPTVYHLLVQGLMHCTDDAWVQLQRDADPYLFEMLLSKPLAIDGGEGIPTGDDSLRPFAFNIQSHMTEKVQNYYDNCKVHVHRASGGKGTAFSAFEKKSKYFHREHDAAQAQAQDQTLYSLFHQSLQSSANDEDKDLLEAIKKWKNSH